MPIEQCCKSYTRARTYGELQLPLRASWEDAAGLKAEEPAPFSDLPVACCSTVDWGYLMQRPQQIMRRYAHYAPVLFVNPAGGAVRRSFADLLHSNLRQIDPLLFSLHLRRLVPLDRTIRPLKHINDAILR